MHQTIAKKGPRAASTYRCAVRESWKRAGRLEEYRPQNWQLANEKAGLAERAAIANGAREAAAKAVMAANAVTGGLLRHVIEASAMLDYYRSVKRTRPVSRIIRQLESEVRSSARVGA